MFNFKSFWGKFFTQKLRMEEKNVELLQYFGITGSTSDCIKAIGTLLNSEYKFSSAAIITNEKRHSIILKEDLYGYFVIKSGFASGYDGEGPNGFARILILLERHQINIEEYVVSDIVWHHIQNMTIEEEGVNQILSSRPVRPSRWNDYIYDAGFHNRKSVSLSYLYPVSIPLALVDERIMDLAIDFHKNPDHSLTVAYRRLEEVIRSRSGILGEGTALFSKVFLADKPLLIWNCLDRGEIKGRGTLFGSVYMAFRNARMHREHKISLTALLREFMLVNELFNLEQEAMTPLELEEILKTTNKI